jgi:hypothetical protein
MGIITELVYIGKEFVDGCRIGRVVGMHEAFLNSALFSYESGRVLDWVSYLQEPWADYLFYDSFDILEKDLIARFQKSIGMEGLLHNVTESASCTADDIIVSGECASMLLITCVKDL